MGISKKRNISLIFPLFTKVANRSYAGLASFAKGIFNYYLWLIAKTQTTEGHIRTTVK